MECSATPAKERPCRRRLPPDLGERQAGAIAPNVLDRGFEAPAPNRKWIADFTYVWTKRNDVCGFRQRCRISSTQKSPRAGYGREAICVWSKLERACQPTLIALYLLFATGLLS